MRSTSKNIDNINSEDPVTEPQLSAIDRIILPLDFDSLAEAKKAIKKLKRHVGLFKVGLTLFVKEGWPVLKAITDEVGEGKVFYDLKFGDIPETVASVSSVVVANSSHVKFITVHASEGKRVLKAAVDALQNGTKILGITVLTSTTLEEHRELGFTNSIKDRVLTLADFSKKAGCGGVVCSALEASAVKERCGQDFIVVTPGIRPKWSTIPGDDQRRVMTLGEAIKSGSDYVVIGRPIHSAPNPVDAAKKIAEEIQQVLEELKTPSR